ncbi:hypothetical protein CDAR_177611 [Caerostris darwini]|uniref:Uncharacterized protein n=1 Tax=Caerostris darwini TaxID=1538125 RepID=A0AAV4P1P8_9ARAC|nr:hypothetical protein CDAR_177611 [Caerostris darwini]
MICIVRGETSDSVITFMARYSPEHSDGGIDHSDPPGCQSRKVENRAFRQLLSLLATTFAISEISCAAFRQEVQQYSGNEWNGGRAAAPNVINKRGLMLMVFGVTSSRLKVLGR